MTGQIKICGIWTDAWKPVVNTFAQNFVDAGEQGAALAIYRHGEPVLSIWAGSRANAGAGALDFPWQENTCVNIFSVGKGLVALCALQLIAKGKLELDRPIADYWPEFAQGGKGLVTLRQVMCHRSGLSAFRGLLEHDDIFDWSKMTSEIVALTPWWQIDSAQGYSPFIYGWILGELVCRASGCATFNDYFQREVAGPLGVACHFGLTAEQQNEVADTAPLKRVQRVDNQCVQTDLKGFQSLEFSNPQFNVSRYQSPGADSIALGKIMKADPRGVTNRAFGNPSSLMTAVNSREWRQAQIPAANGHASAKALAAIFGALGNNGVAGSTRLLPAAQITLCSQEQTYEEDRVLGLPLRFSLGFMLPQDRPDCRFGRGAQAFGHPGAGGCLGFADPDYNLGFGYVTSRMGQSLLIDNRVIRLIDSAYQSLT